MSRKILGNRPVGLVFVLSAPAGTGKTTLVRMLTREFSCIEESVSYTTRAPRPGEKDGRDYFFISPEEFKRKTVQGDFLEHAEVFGQEYGTCKEQVLEKTREGKHVFLVIDTKGALSLQKMGFKAIYIFVTPPGIESLRERLGKRSTEDEENRNRRLSAAEEEMKVAHLYDYQITNCNLEVAYTALKSIVIAEEHRIDKTTT